MGVLGEGRPQAPVLGLLGLLVTPSVECVFITTCQAAERRGRGEGKGGGSLILNL